MTDAPEGRHPSNGVFLTLFNEILLPMWIYRADTFAFIAVNDAATGHYGYTRDELLSLKLTDILEPSSGPAARAGTGAAVCRMLPGRHRTKDGAVVDVEITACAITWEGAPAFLELINDVTERKRMLSALTDSEAKYRDLFENANDAIFIVDADLYYREVNRKALELLGYSKEEMLRLRILDVIPKEQRPRSEAEFSRLRERGAYETFVGQIRTKDGRWIDIEVNSSAIYDDGRVVGSRDIVRDITDRKRLEEDLFRAQKLESLGLLAGGIAHDFNNLLTSVMGNLSLSLLDVEAGSPVHLQLQRAESAAVRARDLTQQLLTFSRGGEPATRSIALDRVVRESVGFALRGSRTKAELDLPRELLPVEADEGQISQVISNLVINAEQAMPLGGELRISCENLRIGREEMPPLKAGAYVRMTVADSGVGIPSDHLKKIFDPYFTTKQRGSGLGLATSYSIVRRHGGHITVDSALGKGSRFSVYLPASDRRPESRGPEEQCVAAGSGRVLVMDDEEMVRDVASRMLQRAGYEVMVCADGAEAVAHFEEAKRNGRPFSVVIMDLTVPGGMGGEEAAAKMRAIDPSVPAIASSGYSNNPVMARYREHGFQGVVSKPYTVERLSGAVRDVLAGGASNA